jgi:hypothetical protein
MHRLLVFALMFSLGHTSVAFAGDTLLAAALRVADELGRTEEAAPPTSAPPAGFLTPKAGPTARASAQEPGASSGMPKGRKVALAIAAAAAFAAIALTIDSKVQDDTPSTKGERTNKL